MKNHTPRSALRHATAFFSASALLGLLAIGAGCSSLDSHTTAYVGVKHFPASDPAKVEILRAEPTKPHERLGEVRVDASTEPAPPIEKVETRLRAEAAKLDADAVVVVLDRVQPVGAYVTGGWYNRSLEVEKDQVLVGIAIKYTP